MADLVYRRLLLTVILFTMTKATTNGQGSLSVAFNKYEEKDASDNTTKCIELCVTVPPFQFPHCNFTGIDKITYGSSSSFRFASRGVRFYFNDIWKDNTVLTATVWRLEGKQSCKRPTNCTHHGDAGIIIPYKVKTATGDVIESNKWKLTVTTLLQCKKCRKNCIPRDNTTGHYTCNEGNKRCMKNWFGEECATFCNTNASNYRCDEHGKKTCLANWFNKDCDQFCDSSLGNYVCDETGRRVCSLHWYGKNCTKYCDNSAKKYKCNDEGEKVCSRNWYGENCTKFCNSSEVRYRCDKKGERICAENWYGEECNYKQITLSSEVYYFEFQEGINRINLGCPESMENTDCLESCENISETVEKYKNNCVSCNARGRRAFFCINSKTRNNICTYVQGTLKELKKDDQSPDDEPLYLGMIGGLCLMIVLIIVLAVLWHRKNKKVATQSPDYEEPDEIRREHFARKYNRAELTLNIDELMRRRQSNTEELGYENKGMMVENPLYDSNRRMRAAPPFGKIDSSEDVFAMRNIAI